MSRAEDEARAALRASMDLNGDPRGAGRKPVEAVRKPLFDPTINLGHILTAVAMLSAGFMAYSALERRVSIVEVQQVNASAMAESKTREQSDAIREIRGDVKDVQRTVNDMARAMTGSRR